MLLRTSNSGGPALVVPIEAAAFRDLDHGALLAALDRARVAQRENSDLQRHAGADHGGQACHHSYHRGLRGRLPYRCRRADSIPSMTIEITPEISG